jgi:hypothetical protein
LDSPCHVLKTLYTKSAVHGVQEPLWEKYGDRFTKLTPEITGEAMCQGNEDHMLSLEPEIKEHWYQENTFAGRDWTRTGK